MKVIEFLNHFWSQNVYEPCSPSETTLLFYLLFEAERQQWKMPFKVPTQLLMAYTGISKQSINDAREGLMKRGLITYTKGVGKGRPALYSLVLRNNETVMIDKDSTITSIVIRSDTTQEVNQKESHSLTPNKTHHRSSTQSQVLSQEATDYSISEETPVMPQKESQEDTPIETQNPTQEQSCELPHEQIQENVDILTHEQSHVMSEHTEEELSQQVLIEESQSSSHVLPMTVLRKKLLEDEIWQEELKEQLDNNGIELDKARLVKSIEEFFDYQERQNVTELDEAECRRFVFYSIRKRFKNKPNLK